MEKIELTTDELRNLMLEASKTWNMTDYEMTEVSCSEGMVLFINRIIEQFKNNKK